MAIRMSYSCPLASSFSLLRDSCIFTEPPSREGKYDQGFLRLQSRTLSFDGSAADPLDQEALEGEENDKGRQGADHGSRHDLVPEDRVLADERADSHGDNHVLTPRDEGAGEEVFVPAGLEGIESRADDARKGQGQADPHHGAETGAAVHKPGLQDLHGDCLEEAPQHPDGIGQRHGGMSEDDPHLRFQQTVAKKRKVHGHDDQGGRQHLRRQHDHSEGPPSPVTETGQAVRRRNRQGHAEERRPRRNHEAVLKPLIEGPEMKDLHVTLPPEGLGKEARMGPVDGSPGLKRGQKRPVKWKQEERCHNDEKTDTENPADGQTLGESTGMTRSAHSLISSL